MTDQTTPATSACEDEDLIDNSIQASIEIELKSDPFVPHSHPFIEWLIGTLRREIACKPANLHHFAWPSDCSALFHTPIAA